MIFDAIANMVSNDQNIDLAVYENRKNRQFQDKQNEKARNFEYQMWLLNNQYNTPSAQMQRYRDAHLNPFLADQTKIGSGNSEGVPSAPMSASGSAAMPAKVPISGIDSPFNYALEQMKVNADVSNQQAQTFNTYMDAALKAYSDGKSELGDKIIDMGFALFGDINKENSYTKERVRLSMRAQDISNQMQNFELELKQKFGEKTAKANLGVLNKQFDKISKDIDVADMSIKLMQAEEKLKFAQTARERQQISHIIAQTKESLASAYEKFAAGALHEADTLTKDQVRSFYIKTVQLKALDDELSYGSHKSQFEGEEFWRAWLSSNKGKNAVRKSNALDYNPLFKGTKQFTSAVGDLIPSVIIPVP